MAGRATMVVSGAGRLLGRIAMSVVVVAASLTVLPTGAVAAVHPQERVLGGMPATTEDKPWAVALTTDTGDLFCGGAVVAPNKVLTAAHCVHDRATGQRRPMDSIRAVAGRADLRADDGVVGEIRDVWVHPEYGGQSRANDVAVLTSSRPLSSVSLPLVEQDENDAYRPGEVGTVVGWGRTRERTGPSPILRSAEIPLVSDAECRRAYPEFDARTMFCAGLPEGGRDACLGDSGGPFVVGGRLVGVVSFGSGCGRAHTPGVYTRLGHDAAELASRL